MKRIAEYRKLFNATKSTELKELKATYRNFMKDCHPDKFAGDEAGLKEAEEKSRRVIEAYHFLVSIAPETLEATSEAYEQTKATSGITDFNYEKQVLKISYVDGTTYEYYGVPRNTYIKMVNSDSQARFARRHIYGTYTYRSTAKLAMA